jgi:hypothetical protein
MTIRHDGRAGGAAGWRRPLRRRLRAAAPARISA